MRNIWVLPILCFIFSLTSCANDPSLIGGDQQLNDTTDTNTNTNTDTDLSCHPVTACTVSYPYLSNYPLTNIGFSESTILKAITISSTDTQQCTTQQVRVF